MSKIQEIHNGIIEIRNSLLKSLPRQFNPKTAKNFASYDYAICENIARKIRHIDMNF